jgi:transposase
MQVIIGVDPHKGSHTAVAISAGEDELDHKKVRACRTQVDQLLAWAEPFPTRTWAIEGADGMGYLLAQQLVATGEHVVNVPATLAARTRLLGSGRTSKNDPNDALSVAVTALRTTGLNQVRPVGHSEVLRLLAKRNNDIGDQRTRLVCRMHALLLELDPGGISKEINASDVDRFLAEVVPTTPAEQLRFDLAVELLADIRRLDEQLKASHKRIRVAVAASGTSVTDVFGIGPIIAAMLIGFTGNVDRFANRDRYAATTAPPPSSSLPAGAPSTGCRPVGTATSTTRCTWPPSASSVNPTPKAAHTSTDASPRARPRRKRCGRSSVRSATPSTATSSLTPPHGAADGGPGRTSGNDIEASVTGPTSLTTGSSARSLPDPHQR